MFDSLFRVRVNYRVYVFMCILIYFAFPDLSIYSYFAIIFSLHQFFLLFYSIGHVIPIRYLFGVLMCVQMLVGPTLAFNGLDAYQHEYSKMRIPEPEYFAYVIPAVICFILGLHIKSSGLKGEKIDFLTTAQFVDSNPNLSYVLIGVGFASSILADFFSADLAFIFILIGSFKFIGAFMFLASDKPLKPLPIIIVFTSILISSLGAAMFHDLIIWLIFLGSFLAIKYRPRLRIKLFAVTAFTIFTVIIQLSKSDYRLAGSQGEESGIESFATAYERDKGENKFYNPETLAKSNIRINQGYIVTNIMNTVPRIVPFQNGEEMMQILEAAILPRILAPNKLKAGDQEIFKKYTGLGLSKNTAMGLSSVGDAYINFGVFGGCVFMFFLGLLYNEVLKAFQRYSKFYPLLILFAPLVFYYPIRPDCELQTILGHLVKSIFLIYVVMRVWEKIFKIDLSHPEQTENKDGIIPSLS